LSSARSLPHRQQKPYRVGYLWSSSRRQRRRAGGTAPGRGTLATLVFDSFAEW